jgi:hypothetical protein
MKRPDNRGALFILAKIIRFDICGIIDEKKTG